MSRKNRKSLLEVHNDLIKQGYAKRYVVVGNNLIKCLETGQVYTPSEIQIVARYNFSEQDEDEKNPQAAIYAIKTCSGESGKIMDMYGPCTNRLIQQFMSNFL